MKFFMLHPKELEIIRMQKNTILVDLRERVKYQKYHHPKAVNLPYSDREGWLDCFQKGQIYILYCDYGNISLLVARELSKKGIMAYTVIGGLNELRHYIL